MMIVKLIPVEYNPRKISDVEFENLISSIKEHSKSVSREKGYRLATTITVNKQGNRIVGGHQRVKALKALGQDWIHDNDITWVDIEPNSPEEKALNLSLNNDDVCGEFDQKKLEIVIEDIYEKNNTLFEKLGFDDLGISLISAKDIKKTIGKEQSNNLEFNVTNESENKTILGGERLNDVKKEVVDQFVLVYLNEEEKKFWMEKFKLPSDKSVWTVEDYKE